MYQSDQMHKLSRGENKQSMSVSFVFKFKWIFFEILHFCLLPH